MDMAYLHAMGKIAGLSCLDSVIIQYVSKVHACLSKKENRYIELSVILCLIMSYGDYA